MRLLKLIRGSLNRFLSKGRHPLFQVVPFKVCVSRLALGVLQGKFSHEVLLPHFFANSSHFSNDLRLLFYFFYNFDLLKGRIGTFGVRPTILNIELCRLFHLLAMRLPFGVKCALLRAISFYFLLNSCNVLIERWDLVRLFIHDFGKLHKRRLLRPTIFSVRAITFIRRVLCRWFLVN